MPAIARNVPSTANASLANASVPGGGPAVGTVTSGTIYTLNIQTLSMPFRGDRDTAAESNFVEVVHAGTGLWQVLDFRGKPLLY